MKDPRAAFSRAGIFLYFVGMVKYSTLFFGEIVSCIKIPFMVKY